MEDCGVLLVALAGAGAADVLKNRSIGNPVRSAIAAYEGPGSSAFAAVLTCASCLGFWTGAALQCVVLAVEAHHREWVLAASLVVLSGFCSSAVSTALECLVRISARIETASPSDGDRRRGAGPWT